MLGDQVRAGTRSTSAPPACTAGEHERELAEAERGPRDEYEKAVDAAGREDVGVKKPTDEAQAEDDDAEEAEES